MNKYIIKNPENFRASIVKVLQTLINNEKISINVEKGIFNYSIREAKGKSVVKKWDNIYFVMIYVDRFKTIYRNMKENDKFLQDVINETIKYDELAFITHQEMNYERWKPLIDEKMKRDKNKFDEKIEASTELFTCRKCRSKKCTYMMAQLRSADEPMNIFVSCIDCGTRWKQ